MAGRRHKKTSRAERKRRKEQRRADLQSASKNMPAATRPQPLRDILHCAFRRLLGDIKSAFVTLSMGSLPAFIVWWRWPGQGEDEWRMWLAMAAALFVFVLFNFVSAMLDCAGLAKKPRWVVVGTMALVAFLGFSLGALPRQPLPPQPVSSATLAEKNARISGLEEENEALKAERARYEVSQLFPLGASTYTRHRFSGEKPLEVAVCLPETSECGSLTVSPVDYSVDPPKALVTVRHTSRDIENYMPLPIPVTVANRCGADFTAGNQVIRFIVSDAELPGIAAWVGIYNNLESDVPGVNGIDLTGVLSRAPFCAQDDKPAALELPPFSRWIQPPDTSQ